MNGTRQMDMSAISITPRQAIVAIGIILAAVGLLGLMAPVSATEYGLIGNRVVECGSPIAPAGFTSDGPLCEDALGSRRWWATPLLAVGIIAVIGGVAVRRPELDGGAA